MFYAYIMVMSPRVGDRSCLYLSNEKESRFQVVLGGIMMTDVSEQEGLQQALLPLCNYNYDIAVYIFFGGRTC